MKKLVFALALLSPAVSALHAQSVQQSGNVSPNHVSIWATNGVIKDGGTASNPFATSFGVVGGSICVNSGPITGAYNALCFTATLANGGVVSIYNYGGATGGLSFVVNGVAQGLPLVPLPTTTNDPACFANSSGSLKDCGFTFTGFANPTASVGLVAVNGAATTAMRSDAAPPLSSSVQTSLTGTNAYVLTGTGAFGFGSEQFVSLTQGGAAADLSSAPADSTLVFPGSAGAAAAKALGSCSGTASALTFNTSTHVFGCNTLVSSVANSDGTLTVSPTTGASVASINLTHANTWSGTQNFNVASTWGTGSGQILNTINGGNTGTSDGAAIFFQNSSVTQFAVGTASAILGGGYAADGLVYSVPLLRLYAGGAEAVRISTTGGVSVGVTTNPGSGVLQLKKQAFSSLTACSSTLEGSLAAVNDSSTATWGATITGSSTNHVLAYCDGSNWTVAGK